MSKTSPRVRIQAMLHPEVAEMVQQEASNAGISVSAMAAVLIKCGIDCRRVVTRSTDVSDGTVSQ